jgi:hypothetical protein
MSDFKVGDEVVRKWGGAPFKVHIVEEEAYIGTILFDVYLNKVKAEDCILWSVYNSPLYKSLQEGKDKPRRGYRR